MENPDNKTKEQLLKVIEALSFKISELEKSETKHKLAEEALKETEERYKGIIRNTSNCIAVYKAVDEGKDFVFVYFNPSAEKVDNIAKEKVIGKKVTKVFPGVIEFGLLKVLQKVWKTGNPQHFPVSMYKDDRIQGYRENYIYKLSSGEIVAIYMDLTDQKLSEETLIEKETRLNFHVNNSPMAAIEWDSDFIVTRWAGQAETIFGWTSEETIGKPIRDLNMIYEEDIAIVQKTMKSLTDGSSKYVVSANRNYTKEGKVIHCEWYNTVLSDSQGKILSVMSQVLDITNRKQAEEKLKESEADLKEAQQLTKIGNWKWDLVKDIITWSDELFNINGHDKNLPIPPFAEMSSYYTAESWKQLVDVAENCIMTGEPYNLELEMIRPDGTKIFTLTKGNASIDSNGKIVKLFGTVQDITERKQAENKLVESEERYRGIVENSSNCVVVYKPIDEGNDFVIVDFNPAAERAENIAKQKVIGRKVTRVFPGVIEFGLLKVFKEVLKTGKAQHFPVSMYKDDRIQGYRENFIYKLSSGEIVAIYKDLIEERKNELALQESQEKLRLLFDNTNELITLADANANPLWVNPAWKAIFGSISEYKNNAMKLIHPDDSVRIAAAWRKMVSGKGILQNEMYRYPAPDGKYLTFESTAYPVEIEGKTHYYIIARDITERHRALKMLEKEKKDIQTIINTAPVMIAYKSKDDHFVNVNSAFADYIGLPVEEIIGKTTFDIVNQIDVAQKGRDHDLEVMRTGKPVLNQLIKWSGFQSEEERWGYYSKLPFYESDGSIEGTISFILDVHERIMAEEALKKSEARLNESQQLANMGNWDLSLIDNKAIWSKNCFTLYGYKPFEFEPTFDHFKKRIHPEDWHIVEENIEEIIRKKEPIQLNLRVILEDGTIKCLQNNVVPIVKDDIVVGLKGINIDITDRIKNEEEIKNAYLQLEELYQYQDKIKENERTVISREIHDELGQMLTALKIDLGWTNENVDAKEVKKKIKGMIDIVSDTITTVQRISSDLRPGLLDDLGLTPAMEWYCQEFEKRSRIKCHFKYDEMQFADESKNLTLYRILQEVLTNVSRHSQAKNVYINLHTMEDSIVYDIFDDGIGIKQEKIDSHHSLGLIGMRERIKQYYGSFDINSVKGNGTKISIVIPFE